MSLGVLINVHMWNRPAHVRICALDTETSFSVNLPRMFPASQHPNQWLFPPPCPVCMEAPMSAHLFCSVSLYFWGPFFFIPLESVVKTVLQQFFSCLGTQILLSSLYKYFEHISSNFNNFNKSHKFLAFKEAHSRLFYFEPNLALWSIAAVIGL